METTTDNKALVEIIQANGIILTEAESIATCFGIHMNNAKSLIEAANAITVLDENDKTSMDAARELRLNLKHIRTKAENDRKDFKEGYLKKGRAIGQIAGMVEDLIKPVEKKLEEQEKTALRLAVERKEKALKERFDKRVEALRPFLAPDRGMDAVYGLKDMPDEAFEQLLAREKEAHAARVRRAEEEKAAAEKIEREKVEEDARIRAENAILIRTGERIKQLAAIGMYLRGDIYENYGVRIDPENLKNLTDDGWEKSLSFLTQEVTEKKATADAEASAQKEKERIEKEAEDERLRVEREGREKAEQELADRKREEERQEQERLKKEREAAEEAERLKQQEAFEAHERAIAPDKVKLSRYADNLMGVACEELSTDDAKAIKKQAMEHIAQAIVLLKQ